MIIPMVSSLSEDVLSAVPRGPARGGLRAGGDQVRGLDADRPAGGALGGRRVVHPGDQPGDRRDDGRRARRRACGRRSRSIPLTSVETMTTYIVAVTGGEASYGSPKYLSLFAVGMALFPITLDAEHPVGAGACAATARSTNERASTGPRLRAASPAPADRRPALRRRPASWRR